MALLYFIEKWNFFLNKKEYVGAILMHLFKVFDTIKFKVLVAKLNGFSKESLKLIFSY